MKIIQATKTQREMWNHYVRKKGGSVFQLWEWKELLEKAFGLRAMYLLAVEKASLNTSARKKSTARQTKVLGVLPLFFAGRMSRKRLISLPFADYAGVLAENEAIAHTLLEVLSKSVGVHFNIFSREKINNLPSGCYVHQPFCHFVMQTECPSDELLKKNIPQKTRNMIYKAQRAGIETEIWSAGEVDGEEFDVEKAHAGVKKQVSSNHKSEWLTEVRSAWRSYFKLYVETMLRLKALPLPYRFFEVMRNIFRERVKLFLATKSEKIVAGIVALEYDGRLYIWGNASDSAYSSLGVNNAVYFSVLKYACEQSNISEVDFGSSVPETSHHFFKKRFGGQERPIYLISNSTLHGSSNLQRYVMNVLRFCPRAMLDKVSYFIYRNF